MGNSESSNPVRNMDKRTARREYRTDFMRAISNYRQRVSSNISRKGSSSTFDLGWADGNIKVFVRKRPIFKHELDAFEFDVATCTSEKTIVIHDARMHNDMKRQLMNHHEFEFDRTFNENVKNDEVYNSTAKSLVEIACGGGYSTCLVYGQTGSGKTFTMSSIYEHAAYDIFNQLDTVVERFSVLPIVSMSFFEIAGDACHDLLNKFRPASLLTGSDGGVHAFPLVEPTVGNAEELIAMIQHGMGVRTTAATGVHDQSSRSHAILRIYIQRQDIRGSDGSGVEGTLNLVDLAGSEHRIDSMYHGKERRKETGNINASLMALKECIRARAEGKLLSFQYRRSKLTQALKCSFTLPSARTIVIATVSPASKDTEHSLNTLRHACIMHGQQDTSENRETRFVTGGTVTAELVGEINLTEIGRRNAGIKRSGGTMDGPKTNNGNVTDSRAARAANNEVEVTEKDRIRQRKAAEARSIAKLLPQYRELLKHYRNQLGRMPRQTIRLQRLPTDPYAIVEVEEECESYQSPARTPRHGHNSSDGDGDGEEVAEEQFDFHSSLNKNKDKDVRHRVDLHELVVSSGGGNNNKSDKRGKADRIVESDAESIEDEVERLVNHNMTEQRSAGSRPNSALRSSRSRPHSAAALQRVNAAGRMSNYYEDHDEEDEAEASEVDEMEDLGGPPSPQNMPQLRSHAGKAAVLHVHCQKAPDEAVRSTPSPVRRPVSSGKVSDPAPRPSPGTQRLEFQRLYDTIYAEAEGVPEHILRRQLTSLLALHGYSEREIAMLFEMQILIQENASMKRAAKAQQQQQQQQQQGPAVSSSRVDKKSTFSPQGEPRAPTRKEDQSSVLMVKSPSVPLAAKYRSAPPVQNSPTRPTATSAGTGRSRVNYEDVTIDAPRQERDSSVSNINAKRSVSVGRLAAAENSKQRVQAEERQRRLAEEKERRERDGVAEAAAQLEQQAAIRRARQEAAKLLREQQEEERKQKAARHAAAIRATKQIQRSDAPVAPSGRRNSLEDPISTQNTAATCRASIRKHEEEIASLMEQLQMDGNTEATQYALKKNIAVRKAALLRERRVAAQKSYLDEDDDDFASANQKVAQKGSTRYATPSNASSASAVQSSPPSSGHHHFQQQQLQQSDSSYSGIRPSSGRLNGGFNAQRPSLHSNINSFDETPVGSAGGRNSFGDQAGPSSRVLNSREGRGVARGSSAGRQNDAFGGPRWEAPVDVNTAVDNDYSGRNAYFSPRSQQNEFDIVHPQQQQRVMQQQQHFPELGASPSAAERVAMYNKRATGAAAAPFGNDYSWDNTP